ncbi:glycosyltransferase [Nakamurella sp.]|uniref:glycosyltransferase n=1 Tax=Nakamurella sp. TaxID=1869182 RepID=UPI003B3B0450
MRLLVAFAGGTGHFLPLVPLAAAARSAGDRVLATGQAAMMGPVAAAGFTTVDSGGRTLADAAVRRPPAPVDRAAEAAVLANVFARRIARERATRLIGIGRTWRPDLILHDEVDAGAAIAADALGVPRVEVVVLGAGGTTERDRWAAGVARTARELGRPGPPAPPVLMVEPAPPGFRNPADPLPGPVLRTRPAALEQAPGGAGPPGAVLDWLDRVPDRPVVWFTLGTVFHQESGDLFDRVTGGLSRLDASVVVTVGPGIDPAELGPRPARVRVERHVPQQVLLPRCHLLVCHGGSGSVLGALALGVPMLLLPLGADQPATTDRCLALGVATALDPVRATRAQMAAAARNLLAHGRYRAAAASWRSACAALPTAARTLDRIRSTLRTANRHSSSS